MFVQFLSLTLSGKAPKGIIPYIIEDYFDRVKALGVEDSYVQTGVQLALHGHKGASGSKGSLNQFAKLPIPNVIGTFTCSHIKGNTYQVGSLLVEWVMAIIKDCLNGHMQELLLIIEALDN